jgi:hypothetical protein
VLLTSDLVNYLKVVCIRALGCCTLASCPTGQISPRLCTISHEHQHCAGIYSRTFLPNFPSEVGSTGDSSMNKFFVLLCAFALATTVAVAQNPSGTGSTSSGSAIQSDASTSTTPTPSTTPPSTTPAPSKEKAGDVQKKQTSNRKKAHHKNAKSSPAAPSTPENATDETNPK